MGVCVGLMSFVATYNGLCVQCPKFFVDLQPKVRLL
jgi:putative transposase